MSTGQILLLILLFLMSTFLIVLVLIQRGKGGGLAGALGGMGGQSAFGTKAGDLFTKITIGVVFFWILLALVAGKAFVPERKKFDKAGAQKVEQKEEPGPATGKANDKKSGKAGDSTTPPKK
jgi:preprotein translocase subunit SecG